MREKQIFSILKKEYPDADIALKWDTPFELLVAVILSAQCTDARVVVVTKDLFKKYKKIQDYANAKQVDFEKDIRSTGFYRNKTKNIIATANIILNNFNGKVPDNMQDLLTLPGVARKTANIVLYYAYGKTEGIPVDTHVGRLSQRLGFSKHKDPNKIEQDLIAKFAKKDLKKLSEVLIFHGRNRCFARKPDCLDCPVSKLCPSAFKV